ncbi:DUF6431 domain-containing protein [Acetobacterium sp. MES1]|uniref:DUF6431 domain-containing protein n=1 Tax=Acetobacterium sp. MES1 TaxID=1899015 RepID=UPI00338D65E5
MHYCPDCQSILQHRDYRLRIMKTEGGTKQFIQIERLKCNHCERLHNALPDFLVPYKHYVAQIISGVLDEVISADDLELSIIVQSKHARNFPSPYRIASPHRR